METNTNIDAQFMNDIAPLPEKPQFLKVLCILSFIACGLMILGCGMGVSLLALGEDTIATAWEQVLTTQPQLENVNPVEFFHELGMYCLYALIANIISLVGVIMMWQLNKFGFFIYVIAEIGINFFRMSISLNGEEQSAMSGIISSTLIDLVFIVMYAINLKYMKKKVVTIPQS